MAFFIYYWGEVEPKLDTPFSLNILGNKNSWVHVVVVVGSPPDESVWGLTILQMNILWGKFRLISWKHSTIPKGSNISKASFYSSIISLLFTPALFFILFD